MAHLAQGTKAPLAAAPASWSWLKLGNDLLCHTLAGSHFRLSASLCLLAATGRSHTRARMTRWSVHLPGRHCSTILVPVCDGGHAVHRTLAQHRVASLLPVTRAEAL
jgi:hypothetical protein